MTDLAAPRSHSETVLRVLRLDPTLPLPSYAHDGDAGLDLCAAAEHVLEPGSRTLVPTGVAVAIPEGHAGLVVPRSGRALREGLAVVNAPGVIDSQYRGEVGVILLNTDTSASIHISRGDKIAQLLLVPVARACVQEVPELPPTVRGGGGFGSTGR